MKKARTEQRTDAGLKRAHGRTPTSAKLGARLKKLRKERDAAAERDSISESDGLSDPGEVDLFGDEDDASPVAATTSRASTEGRRVRFVEPAPQIFASARPSSKPFKMPASRSQQPPPPRLWAGRPLLCSPSLSLCSSFHIFQL